MSFPGSSWHFSKEAESLSNSNRNNSDPFCSFPVLLRRRQATKTKNGWKLIKAGSQPAKMAWEPPKTFSPFSFWEPQIAFGSCCQGQIRSRGQSPNIFAQIVCFGNKFARELFQMLFPSNLTNFGAILCSGAFPDRKPLNLFKNPAFPFAFSGLVLALLKGG